MSEEKPYFHAAPVRGVTYVFANLEYPRDRPPETITVDGITWRRERPECFGSYGDVPFNEGCDECTHIGDCRNG